MTARGNLVPKRSFIYQFGQPHRFETIKPLIKEELEVLFDHEIKGITVEIVMPGIGAGYLFHVEKLGNNDYRFRSYTAEVLPASLNLDLLTRFISHTSGLRFDKESWLLSKELNRKVDTKQRDLTEDNNELDIQE